MIRNIQLNHSGKYRCTVQTAMDNLSETAEIIVRGKSIIYKTPANCNTGNDIICISIREEVE